MQNKQKWTRLALSLLMILVLAGIGYAEKIKIETTVEEAGSQVTDRLARKAPNARVNIVMEVTQGPEQAAKDSGESSHPVLLCTHATRQNNEPTRILAGDPFAVRRVGIGSEGDGKWGLRCVEDYQKTGCHIAIRRERADYDLWPSADACVTDNEEFEGKTLISITCCKVRGFE